LGWVILPFNPFGTFGAVIRIRSAFRDRKQLFDVGIAGPLAGFVFVVPAMILGIVYSKDFVFTDTSGVALEFGEPLIFQLAANLLYTAGDGSSISLHPVGMAAWFGMLATSLNLLPIGQLDGGHIVYALFGPKIHRYVSYLAFLGLISISLLSWPSASYLVFAFVLIIMGFRHPRPYQEHVGIKGWRWVIAAIGLLIFILTFIPVPIQLIEHTVTI
jgi:membrane-associated protease RseP (regulator of RpoE activity)